MNKLNKKILEFNKKANLLKFADFTYDKVVEIVKKLVEFNNLLKSTLDSESNNPRLFYKDNNILPVLYNNMLKVYSKYNMTPESLETLYIKAGKIIADETILETKEKFKKLIIDLRSSLFLKNLLDVIEKKETKVGVDLDEFVGKLWYLTLEAENLLKY